MNRLLIVDDALLMRKMIREIATEAGWKVVGEAVDGQEGVSLYFSTRPDLVTMDLMMPVMDGLEALKAIRAGDPAAQVVVVTAINQKQTLAEAIGAGASDFLLKPFERESLIRFLNNRASSANNSSDAPRNENGESP